MIFPIRNMNNETTSLCILPITSIDSAVMQFNYHPAQIQSYTKTDTSIETIGRRLIKTFEYLFQFIGVNAGSAVNHFNLNKMLQISNSKFIHLLAQADFYFTSIRRIFKSIRQQVYQYFIKIIRINPRRKLLLFIIKTQVYVPFLRLISK